MDSGSAGCAGPDVCGSAKPMTVPKSSTCGPPVRRFTTRATWEAARRTRLRRPSSSISGKRKWRSFTPSRLFIYYNERALEGTVSTDSGAMLRDGIKCVARQGVCAEPMWPYVEQKFADRPSAQCYVAGKLHPAVSYQRGRAGGRADEGLSGGGLSVCVRVHGV